MKQRIRPNHLYRSLWLFAMFILAPQLSFAGEQSRAAEIMAKGLYCHTFDFLRGDMGIILGLLVGFMGLLILIFKQMNVSGLILIIAGVCLTALPSFFETTTGGIFAMAKGSGIIDGSQDTFTSNAVGRQSLLQNCSDYKATLTFIQDTIITGEPYSFDYDEDGNPVIYASDGTAIDAAQFGITSADDFYSALGKRECSGGSYSCVNQFGFLGKYQMGDLALQDAGYKDANGNWLGVNGVYDQASYLANAAAQEDAVRKYHTRVQGYLKNAGLWNKVGTTYKGQAITASGLIGAAHLAGVGNLKTYFNGSNWVDGNGTSPGEYIKLMNGRTVQ